MTQIQEKIEQENQPDAPPCPPLFSALLTLVQSCQP